MDERQTRSALACAAEERTAYILPVRMDDTRLPGLLPTIRYIDARVEGADGFISVLREKLDGTPGGCTNMGRVPQTRADIDLRLTLRPEWWEYWLYAGVLKIGLIQLHDKFRDYEIGYAKRSGITLSGREAYDFLVATRDLAGAGFNLVRLPIRSLSAEIGNGCLNAESSEARLADCGELEGTNSVSISIPRASSGSTCHPYHRHSRSHQSRDQFRAE